MKRLMFLFVMLNFILTSISVAAAPVEVEVIPKSITTKPYSPVIFKLNITNNQNSLNRFLVRVTGPHNEWIITGVLVQEVRAWSSDTVELKFYPGDKRGTYEYRATVTSYENPSATAETDFYLDIPFPITIEDFSVQRTGNLLNLNLELKSTEKKNVDILFSLNDGEGKVMEEIPVSMLLVGTKAITRSIPLSEHMLAGTYFVTASVLGTELMEEESFAIKPFHNIVERTEEISNPLYRELIIYVNNNGNVVERDYRTEYAMPVDYVTGMLPKPENCHDSGGNRVCSFFIAEIQPGTTSEVSYRLDYLPTYGVYLVMILIVAGLVLFSFFSAAKPRLKKKCTRKGEDRHSMVLELKNPFYHNLKNVMVRDWVSPLAQVLHEEIDSTRPVIRRSDAGTELIWNLGNMRPREERVLTYRIKTLVQGSLKMPRAYARFNTAKGKKFRVFSKSLIVK